MRYRRETFDWSKVSKFEYSVIINSIAKVVADNINYILSTFPLQAESGMNADRFAISPVFNTIYDFHTRTFEKKKKNYI